MRAAHEISYPYPVDPQFNPAPASEEDIAAHFSEFMANLGFEDEFEQEEFEGVMTEARLAAIGKKFFKLYAFDKSEYFG